MKRASVLALFGVTAAFVGSGDLQAQCSNRDLLGYYVASGTGYVLFTPPPPSKPIQGPISRIGRVYASGDGVIDFEWTKGSYSGDIYEHPFGGFYTVKNDCNIDILFTLGPDPLNVPLPFTGTVAVRGNQVPLTSVTPGTVANATLHKQRVGFCSNQDLIGGFVIDMTGWTVVPGPRNGPFGRTGRVVSNGQGVFTGNALANYAGLLEVENISGTYAVDSQCKFTMNYTVTESLPTNLIFPNFPFAAAGPSYQGTIDGILIDRENAVVMQVRPTGVAISGTLKK